MNDVFFDGKESKESIIKSIRSAKKNIKIVMYLFTLEEIANELIRAKERGVDVKVVLSNKNENEKIISILSSKCELFVDTRPNSWGYLHSKFCIIDDSLVITGSFNFTANAVNNNRELLSISDDKNVVEKCIKEFDDLLMENNQRNLKTNEISNKNTNNNNNDSSKINNWNSTLVSEFTEQLQNLITIRDSHFNASDLISEGYKLSLANEGSPAIFRTKLESILSNVQNQINNGDNIKMIIKSDMRAHFEDTKNMLNNRLHSDINSITDRFQPDKYKYQEIKDRIEKEISTEKQDILDKEGQSSMVRLQIEELNEKILSLDQLIVVRPFWTLPNMVTMFVLLIIYPYLCVFFASALWKIFFEEAAILELLTKGITPPIPPIVDANALVEIFSNKGILFGALGCIFFIIPVLLTNFKLIAPKEKILSFIFSWIIGLFAIDVVVSILVSQHTFRIKSLLEGSDTAWRLTDAIQSGEFWLIFIFGALPLFLNKYLMENITRAFKDSNPSTVDREKHLQREHYRDMKFEKLQILQNLQILIDKSRLKIENLNKDLNSNENIAIELRTKENNEKNEKTQKYNDILARIEEIYRSFINHVDAGNRIFLQKAINGSISAFKQGYYSYFTERYLQSFADARILELEGVYQNWVEANFQ